MILLLIMSIHRACALIIFSIYDTDDNTHTVRMRAQLCKKWKECDMARR